jgi:hypothetical protein
MRRQGVVCGLGIGALASSFVIGVAAVVGWPGSVSAQAPAQASTPLASSSAAATPAVSEPTGNPEALGLPDMPLPNDHEAVWRHFRGKVVLSDEPIAPPSAFSSDGLMVSALKRLSRTSIDGVNGFWRFHGVAFLDPVPSTSALRLRATDVTEPKHRHEVRVFEINGEPGLTELPLDDFVLTAAMGFEPGHRYEIVVERGGDEAVPESEHHGRKPAVYAKGVITLR